MVNALLEFSRIEAGRAQATFVPVDLAAFTRELAGMFQSAVESAGLTLVLDCPPLPEPIYVDPEMWEKIVCNLVSNAVKYTHHGEIRVSLAASNGHVRLDVGDTGVGIPADELPRIFQRFHRVRGTSGRSHEGTGIGLALVQELVKLHGGSVAAESTPGAGTTVTVTLRGGSAHLPAEHVVEQAPRLRSPAESAAPFVEEALRWSRVDDPGVVHRGGAGLSLEVAEEIRAARILLADDNPDLRAYVKGILEQVFPAIITAADGQEALEKARAESPDVVLSDVMMPRLDGFGLVRELRRDDRTAAIPIILLSARAGEEATVEGLASGADDYLAKPFSSRELLARVKTHLEMARVRRQAARQEVVAHDLRQSIRMRDEFLSVASHELRTPLTTLSLQVESLLRVARGAPAAEMSMDAFADRLDRVRRQTFRLQHLVEMLLDSSATAGGAAEAEAEAEAETLDLAALAQHVLDRQAEEAARAGTRLTLDAVPVVGTWPPARVDTILTHLVKNAIKFGAGQPVDVCVAAAGDVARLSVRDRGIGIAPDQQDRIFQRLERGVPVDRYGGLGLGLWIVRQLVESMRGTVQVESRPGRGATFTVELPIAG
jgi:signal transduction histidine kinase